MPDTSQTPGKSGFTWVVVADASRADFYKRQARRGQLEVVQRLAEPRARDREQDLVADAPGRAFDSGGQGRHAMEPDHTTKQHLREAFAQRIAAALEEGRVAGQYKQLVIVAAPAMLGDLRRRLSDTTSKLVAAEFDKDLAGHDPAEIAALIDVAE